MKTFFAVVTLGLIASSSLWGQMIRGFTVQDEIFLMVNTEGLDSAPSPILNVPGVRVSWDLPLGLSLEPGVSAWMTHFDWNGERAVPIEEENRTALVFGLPVSLPVVWRLAITDKAVFSAGGGFVIHVRFGIPAGRLPEVEYAKVGDINGYFWGGGRFLYPETLAAFDYSLGEKIALGISFRILWPIFNLWTGEALPFLDGAVFAGGVRLAVKL